MKKTAADIWHFKNKSVEGKDCVFSIPDPKRSICQHQFFPVPRDINSIKSELIIDDSCDAVIKDLKKLNIKLPGASYFSGGEIDFDLGSEYRLTPLEDENVYALDAKNGMDEIKEINRSVCAYDESIATYAALEGKAVMTSHALVYMRPDQYIPITYLTLNFYTQSDKIINVAKKSAIKTDNPDRQAAIDRAFDKMNLIKKYCINNTILLIDGPLIAGDAYTSVMTDIIDLSERNIVPVFFIKNSNSRMIYDYLPEYCEGYNSDMHWANELLKTGERTRFFKYTDQHNKINSKVFCYIKFLKNQSPVRIELPTAAYEKYLSSIESILDIIYYLLLVQGNPSNPQIRPIAVAREIMRLYDINREIRYSDLTPVMNEERGMS